MTKELSPCPPKLVNGVLMPGSCPEDDDLSKCEHGYAVIHSTGPGTPEDVVDDQCTDGWKPPVMRVTALVEDMPVDCFYRRCCVPADM